MRDYAETGRTLQAQLRPPVLRLPADAQDRAALAWLADRVSEWTAYIRRRRNSLPLANLTPDEGRVLRRLVTLADSLRELREEIEKVTP